MTDKWPRQFSPFPKAPPPTPKLKPDFPGEGRGMGRWAGRGRRGAGLVYQARGVLGPQTPAHPNQILTQSLAPEKTFE